MAIKTWVYTVQGNGAFPTDMLRYARSCPYSENDSGAIDSRGTRKVTLIAYADPVYTEQRWLSFGWNFIR